MSKEFNIPCQTFVKIMQCDCGGELRLSSDLEDLRVGPPYKHICNKCGKIEYFESTYPKTFSSYQMPENKEKDCPAWSGKDCTRHPYEEGCLKDGVSD